MVAAVSRVPACGHVAVTYAAHVARQRGLCDMLPLRQEPKSCVAFRLAVPIEQSVFTGNFDPFRKR